MPLRRSKQLSYKATDVESWSFVVSNFPVRNESMNEMVYKRDHILNCGSKSSKAMILEVMDAILTYTSFRSLFIPLGKIKTRK